jgi:hypothetical protein
VYTGSSKHIGRPEIDNPFFTIWLLLPYPLPFLRRDTSIRVLAEFML